MFTKFNGKGGVAMVGNRRYEEARRFLRAPREASRELAIRMEQLRRWRETAERTTKCLGGVRVQEQGSSRVESCACELAELEAVIEAVRQRAHALRERQEEVLARLGDARLTEVLRLYYQCSFTWVEAAEHMGYSERYIQRLHMEALARVERILEEDGELMPEHRAFPRAV